MSLHGNRAASRIHQRDGHETRSPAGWPGVIAKGSVERASSADRRKELFCAGRQKACHEHDEADGQPEKLDGNGGDEHGNPTRLDANSFVSRADEEKGSPAALDTG
jgi:hypothetical protein